jgi:hypothetical protein
MLKYFKFGLSFILGILLVLGIEMSVFSDQGKVNAAGCIGVSGSGGPDFVKVNMLCSNCPDTAVFVCDGRGSGCNPDTYTELPCINQ